MNHWQPIAHASELAHPGDFVQLPIGPRARIVLTNFGGDIVAWDGRCPHRGAWIYGDLMAGNREPRCIYHSRVAHPDQVAQHFVRQHGGFLFVGPRDPEPAAADESPALWNFIDYGTEQLTLHSTLRFVMDCPWTVAVENILDSEHIEPVHGASLSKLALVSQDITMYRTGSWCGSSIERFRSESGRLGHMSKFFAHEQRFDYCHAHIYPYSAISSTRGWTYSLQHYIPRADGRTEFIHRLYAAPTTRPLPEFFASVAQLNETIFREDAAVCAQVPEAAGALTHRERRIAHFREAVGRGV